METIREFIFNHNNKPKKQEFIFVVFTKVKKYHKKLSRPCNKKFLYNIGSISRIISFLFKVKIKNCKLAF
jgi:hypothetical protein